jgi:hypothetical protein
MSTTNMAQGRSMPGPYRTSATALATQCDNLAAMTSATAPLLAAAAPARVQARWPRVVEFLVVGGATLALYPLAWLLRTLFGLDESEYFVSFFAFYAAWLINDPHFSVTYLLFYKDAKNRAFGSVFSPAQRARYLLAGLVVPLALAAWSVTALIVKSAYALGLMIELMFLLVGWHYVKQGFGVLTVLSARRGVRFSPGERWALLGHCLAGWAYAWSSPSSPGIEVEEKGVVYTSLAHSASVERVAQVIFALTTVALVFMLVRKWLRERRLPPAAPLTGFMVSIWCWTVYSGIDPLMLYVIPGLHSLQYLYFVWLMKRNEARESEGPPHFGRPVAVQLGILAATALALGWFLFHGAASMFELASAAKGREALDLGALGPTPYFAALFTFVNIHHYFMDHVIWRRDNPDTRYLRDP